MDNLKIGQEYKDLLHDFSQGLISVYATDLVSVILYGSAASGEFVHKKSNLNLLVVLKDTELRSLKKSSSLIKRFKRINALFLTEKHILSSLDVFPIEFLDMQENYFLLYGKDILKHLNVDWRNLRFQCEQELKEKLLGLRQSYILNCNNIRALRSLLFVAVTPVIHILRSFLRVKGKHPAYIKQEFLRELNSEFTIDVSVWEKILLAKANKLKLNNKEVEPLFTGFVKDLELIVNAVDMS